MVLDFIGKGVKYNLFCSHTHNLYGTTLHEVLCFDHYLILRMILRIPPIDAQQILLLAFPQQNLEQHKSFCRDAMPSSCKAFEVHPSFSIPKVNNEMKVYDFG